MNRRFKLSLCSAAVATLLSAPAIAANVTTGKVSINSDSQTVAISGYTQPVVIAGVPTMNDGEPGVVSVSGVSANGFDIRFKEWPYLDGVHGLEDVAYMVLEKGRHQMSDGSIWEVGTISQNSGNAQVFFGAPFDGTPVVLLTSQTQSEGDTHALRAHSVTRHSFSSRLFEQELGDSHGVEVTGYVAIYQPKGVGKTDSGIGYTLSTEVAANNVLHTPLGKLTVQEEQSKDSETRHTHEVLAIARIGGSTFATDNSLYGGDAITLRYTPTYEVVPGDKTGDNDNIALMGTNNLTAANYSASSTYSYDSPQGAFDGHIFPNIKVNNDATALEKRGTWLAYGVPQWLQVDFGRKTMVTGFSITSSTSYPSRTPKEVTLEVSNDGMTYHSHETRLLAKGGEQVALSEPAVGQYFRLKVSSTHGDSYIQVGELEYYGDFVDLVGDAPNPPSMTPEISCKAWLDKDSSLADGIYLLDPDEAGGVDPFYAYCDMTTDGGGWTRVGHFYNVNDLGDFSETPAQVSDPGQQGLACRLLGKLRATRSVWPVSSATCRSATRLWPATSSMRPGS